MNKYISINTRQVFFLIHFASFMKGREKMGPQVKGLFILILIQYVVLDSDFTDLIKGEKCFDELGCFSIGYPYFDGLKRPISLFPQDREVINTTFRLFTPQNPQVEVNFTNLKGGNVKDILHTGFDPKADTKFIVAGYISEQGPDWELPMTRALIKTEGSNVFLIDWTGGDKPPYEQAVANARVVGAEIALFINHLQDVTDIDLQSIHIIGHSLGSHVTGYAGKRLKTVGRISGLDPAGPYFTYVDPVVRLDRGDALFVDIIHTNAKLLTGFGLDQNIGDFNFHPNGGHIQPGCPDIVEGVLGFYKDPVLEPTGPFGIKCNHYRAPFLFLSSIRNNECELLGKVCDNWETYLEGKCGDCKNASSDKPENCIEMGIHADRYVSMVKKNRSLNMYLKTTATEPFCT